VSHNLVSEFSRSVKYFVRIAQYLVTMSSGAQDLLIIVKDLVGRSWHAHELLRNWLGARRNGSGVIRLL
jgi:hypothetical protein